MMPCGNTMYPFRISYILPGTRCRKATKAGFGGMHDLIAVPCNTI